MGFTVAGVSLSELVSSELDSCWAFVLEIGAEKIVFFTKWTQDIQYMI